jgi:hypothetical protein
MTCNQDVNEIAFKNCMKYIFQHFTGKLSREPSGNGILYVLKPNGFILGGGISSVH